MNILEQAVGSIIRGEVIIAPAEGCYVFMCDPFNTLAVNKCLMHVRTLQVQDEPVILLGDLEDLPRLLNSVSSDEEQKVMNNWPGDANILFAEPNDFVNKKFLNKENQLALRLPAADYMLEILHAVGQPLLAFNIYKGQMPAKDKQDLYDFDLLTLKNARTLPGTISKTV